MGSAEYDDADGVGDFLEEGWEKVSMGDLDGALRDAESTLRLDPASPEAHNLMAFVLGSSGRAAEAGEHYRKALEIDPTYGEAMLNYADLCMGSQPEAALVLVDDLLSVSDIEEERIEAQVLRVEALNVLGRSEEASEAAEALIDAEPERPEVELQIGRALYEVGALELAEGRLRRALLRGVMAGDAEYYLGVIADQRDDLDEATLHFIRARELDAQVPPPPWALPSAAFERIVQEVVRTLPDDLRGHLEGTLVVCTELPGIELVADGLDPRTMVFADAVKGAGAETLVGRLFVYQRCVELGAGAPDQLAAALREAIPRELLAVAAGPQRPE